MNINNQSLLNAALYYAELGYKVFPLVPGGKTPITARGCLDASSDAAQVEAWWTQHPTANIGLSTDGLLALDIDGKNNPYPGHPDRFWDLAQCPVSLTPGEGSHHVFRQPPGKAWRNTMSKIAPMVDTRANGGYIVVAPSIIDGKRYAWAPTMELQDGPEHLPEPPSWLVAQLDSHGNGHGNNGNLTNLPTVVSNEIPAGQRHTTLVRLAGAMRRIGMSAEEILGALLEVNSRRCHPPKSSREVLNISRSVAKYEPDQISVAVIEGHFVQDAEASRESQIIDPGPLPEGLLRIPGFVSEVMDYTLETSPYPNPAMAFAGALALLATLSGRKVRDSGDNRTNLYILALAHSSAGKDRPRKVNVEILHAIGVAGRIGGMFASGEGLQDAMAIEPCMLFQTDEIDGLLQSINKSKDARHESIMGTLLTMYSSSNSVFPMRRKAGSEAAGSIDQPCLVVLGTAIPNHYYDALSERMLTNGFFARTIVIECGKRSAGQEPQIRPIPDRVLQSALWWEAYQPGTGGNLASLHPVPNIVPHTVGALELLVETRLEAEAEYGKAEALKDPVGTTVWGRVSEQVRKLALLYAISERCLGAEIDRSAVDWARRLVMHGARRMIFVALGRVAENPFHTACLKCLTMLREAEVQEMPHSSLMRRMRMDARTFQALIETLEQQGDLQVRIESTAGRKGRHYALRGAVRP